MKLMTQKGFTLVEMLVVVALSGILGTALIGFFISQQRSHTAQEETSFLQQNGRAALGILSRELRMAGYDPDQSGLVPFSPAGKNQIIFQRDIAGTPTTITFSHFVNAANDQYDLRREGRAVAEGIEAIGFAFSYDSDGDGELDRDAGGNIIYAIPNISGFGAMDSTVNWFQVKDDTDTVTDMLTLANVDDIRGVKIWVLARSQPIRDYTNNNTYYVGSQKITANDNRRRMLLKTAVRCRNLGLGQGI